MDKLPRIEKTYTSPREELTYGLTTKNVKPRHLSEGDKGYKRMDNNQECET
jgi:hypothetical protein